MTIRPDYNAITPSNVVRAISYAALFSCFITGAVWLFFAALATHLQWQKQLDAENDALMADTRRYERLLAAKTEKEATQFYADSAIIEAKGMADANETLIRALVNIRTVLTTKENQ